MRGGRREGAGRKSAPQPRKTVTLRLSQEAYQKLTELSVLQGKSRQQIVNDIIEKM